MSVRGSYQCWHASLFVIELSKLNGSDDEEAQNFNKQQNSWPPLCCVCGITPFSGLKDLTRQVIMFSKQFQTDVIT